MQKKIKYQSEILRFLLDIVVFRLVLYLCEYDLFILKLLY